MELIARYALLVLVFLSGITICQGNRDINEYFTDLQDEPNDSWDEIKTTLDNWQNSEGLALGSTILVNHELTKVGPYGQRKITRPLGLHTVTSSYVHPDNWARQTRWYQEDDNTQIFRLFPGEDNVRNLRENAPRVEAFSVYGWQRGDGWHEFSGRYTFLKVRPGAVLQIKHNATYWSMQLVIDENTDGTFDLSYAKLRAPSEKVVLVKDVVGKGIDVRVLDDGENHKVYVDGYLRVDNIMSDRPPEDVNRARWGMYTPKSVMDRDILIFTTGVYVGPAREDIGRLTDGEEGAESTWDKLVGILNENLEDIKNWWNSSPEDEAKFMEELQQELDAEPDAEVLERYYADSSNEGNGFI